VGEQWRCIRVQVVDDIIKSRLDLAFHKHIGQRALVDGVSILILCKAVVVRVDTGFDVEQVDVLVLRRGELVFLERHRWLVFHTLTGFGYLHV